MAMNRRRFLELLGMATVGGTIAYSFPDIIVPKNIIPISNSMLFGITDSSEYGFGFTGFQNEIYPALIEDNFFINTPWLEYIRSNQKLKFAGGAIARSIFNKKQCIIQK